MLLRQDDSEDHHEPITLEWALEQMNLWHGRAKAAEEERDRYRDAIGELYLKRAADAHELRMLVRSTFGITQAFRRRQERAGGGE